MEKLINDFFTAINDTNSGLIRLYESLKELSIKIDIMDEKIEENEKEIARLKIQDTRKNI